MGEVANLEARYEVTEVESFVESGGKAVVCINTALSTETPTFPVSDAVEQWQRSLGGLLGDIKYADPQSTTFLRVIGHRVANQIWPVAGAFSLGTAGVLTEREVKDEAYIAEIRAKLQGAGTRISCITTLVNSICTEYSIFEVQPAEIVKVYADTIGLQVEVLGEIPSTTTGVSKPNWDAALEEIAWNAGKYRARKIVMWCEGGKILIGDNGIGFNEDETMAVNTGTRLNPDIDGGGQGMGIIRSLGFDFYLRKATPEENTQHGIKTVAELEPALAEGVGFEPTRDFYTATV